jgi:hypothetical protein
MISFLYPALLAIALYCGLVITAFYSEPESPAAGSGVRGAIRQVHSLVWAPPFLRHWQFMKNFFSLTIAKLFITWFAVVPIAAHILSNAPDSVKVPHNCKGAVIVDLARQASTEVPSPPAAPNNQVRLETLCDFWAIPIGLPFKWELLWLASFLFFLAFAIYMIACPNFVKRFPSYGAYLDVGNSVRWIVWEFYHMNTLPEVRRSIEDRLITKEHALPTNQDVTSKPRVTKDNTYLVFKHDGHNYLFGSPKPTVPEDKQKRWEQDVFWEVFEGWTKSRPRFASLIRWLLRGAGALALYAVAQNIVAALTYIG